MLSTAALVGLSGSRVLGPCLSLDIFIAKPGERGASSGEVTYILCHLVMKADAPPACPVTKSKMLQLARCL